MKSIKLLLAATLTAGAAWLTGCSKGDSTIDKVEYIAVQEDEDGNWSFLSPDGKKVLPDEFKKKPSCVIEGAFSVQEGDDENAGYTVYKFDEKKPQVIGDLEKLKGVGHYEGGLLPVVRKKSRITIVDKNGKDKFVLEPIKGKEITSCSEAYSDGMLLICDSDGKYGFVNESGKAVIEPKYDDAYDFVDGLALVSKSDAEGEDATYFVIDKKGATKFKIRKGQRPIWYSFSEGHIAVRDDNDHVVLYDEKGETVKISSKAEYVEQLKGKTFVFRNSDGEYGVMDIEGEVIVRAKYKSIYMLDNGNYLCNSDDKAVVLNSKGDDELTIDDYEFVGAIGKFGLWGKEKHTYVKLDDKGKPVKNCEFHNIGFSSSADGGRVLSDYFNVDAVVNDVIALIGSNGVGKYAIGAAASSVLSGPENYAFDRYVSPDDLKREGYRYDITTRVNFDTYIADWDYTYDYSRTYYFKNANIESIALNISTQSDWGNDGSEALVKGLQQKGATIIAQNGTDFNTYVASLKYGNLVVIVTSQKGSANGTVEIGKYTPEVADALKKMIGSMSKSDGEVASADTWNETEVAVDTVAVAEEYY